MSCNCKHTDDKHEFPCLCDSFVHPAKLNIGMGLTDLPRQIAGFPEFRRAMLFSLRPKDAADVNKTALNAWKTNQQDDLGVMLLEMWAYICDSLCFYDKVIAQEEYLRTAQRRPSLRKLVALTGYLPRPAVGSSVYLTALADGRLKLLLPEGTAFRSSGFNGNPPQVFETDDKVFIHPLTGKWNVKPPQPDFIERADPSQLLIIPQVQLQPGIPLLLIDDRNNLHTQALWLTAAEPYTGNDTNQYNKLKFNGRTKLPFKYPLKNLQLQMPVQSAGLWTVNVTASKHSISSNGKSIVLDGLHREIKSGQFILISRNKRSRWFTVEDVKEVSRQQSAGDNIIINNSTFNTPGVSINVTKIFFDRSINAPERKAAGDSSDWTDSNLSGLTVHFMMQPAGVITNEQKATLAYNDPVFFKEKAERPIDDFDPANFFLTDKNINAVKLNGKIRYSNSSLRPSMTERWDPALVFPVQAFGNVIKASRGETVPREILGSGDATIINQTFKLKKKPLTYFPASTVTDDRGLKNTLRIYVNGIRWTEVPSFFNRTATEEIYIVRQNDDGDSYVTFGDGLRGQRLPTGADNIVAAYRFGAEQAVPPAATITQISKPVKDLAGINNPLPASGGADAETAASLQSTAPKSILTLGRIVSIQDAEAVALTVPGVRAVQVEWRWYEEKQCPLIYVWYTGGAGVKDDLEKRLRSMSDPTVIIYAEMAESIATTLKINAEIDTRFVYEDVLKELRNVFTDIKKGMLAPENIGIGKPLFRSKIFAAALSVPGVVAVKNILFNDGTFSGFAKTPGAGKYFDFEKGSLLITINE